VPVTIPELGRSALEDNFLFCRIARRSLKDLPPDVETFDNYMNHVARRAKDVLNQLGTVELKNEALTIQPGETGSLCVRFGIGPDVPRHARFFAICYVLTADLTLEIVT
jgi:hypothetical protein